MNAGNAAFILYVDHEGHPAPLTECFHATASRRLSSTVDRYPPSTLTEVDSAFCPQCLQFHDAASAARLGFCPKPSCQQCPLCQSIVSVTAKDGQCCYQCGNCPWNSKTCDLTIPMSTADGPVDKLELARAAEDLGSQLSKRRQALQAPLESLHQALIHSLDQERTEIAKSKSGDRRPQRKAIDVAAAASSPQQQAWSIEALEASLQMKRSSSTLATDAIISAIHGLRVERHDGHETETTDKTSGDASGIRSQELPMQILNSSIQLATRQDLLPLPIPLRPRKSRRCRAELAEGRPGILLKPKLNPLEGDSSLRTGHGQWWKKDSSAIHVIPRVRVVKYERVTSYHSFLIKVMNPTLGMVRIRFTASQYDGEVMFIGMGSSEDGTNIAAAHTTALLDDLLVETLTQTKWTLQLHSHIMKDLAPTDTGELLSAEDSIIELGGKARQTPVDVTDWDGTTAAGVLASIGTNVMMRLIGASGSNAWFEIMIPQSSVHNDQDVAAAVAFQLQVELGKGSWDSSLIQEQSTGGSDPDRVSFDLVLAWQQQTAG